jgi:PPOX class probable F420-dependent enzyme
MLGGKGADVDTDTSAAQSAHPGASPTPPFDGKYLSLTTFKRDGAAVATPVWFVADNGRLLVLTDAESFKVKRIRRNPDVSVARCSASGRLHGERVAARAEILPDTAITHAKQLMNLRRPIRVQTRRGTAPPPSSRSPTA